MLRNVPGIEVSPQSHPFYTGKNVLLDTAGRVDKFRKCYGTRPAAAPAEETAPAEQA